MQCPVCHNEIAGQPAFCNHCGASLTAAQPGPVVATVPAVPQAAASTGLSPNAAAAISYITFVPALLFLLIEPYNKTPLVRFHSFQSIGIAVCWFVIWFVVAIGSMLLALIPGVRMLILLVPFLYAIAGLGMFVLWLMAILKAFKGEYFKLPIIGDFAMKQAQG